MSTAPRVAFVLADGWSTVCSLQCIVRHLQPPLLPLCSLPLRAVRSTYSRARADRSGCACSDAGVASSYRLAAMHIPRASSAPSLPPLQTAACVSACVRAPLQRVSRAAIARAGPLHLQQRRLADGLRRRAALPARGKAPWRRCVRASAQDGNALEDLKLLPCEWKREYLPHEQLRAALALDESCSANDAPTRMYVSCKRIAALLARPALLGRGAEEVRFFKAPRFDKRHRGYMFVLGGDDRHVSNRLAARGGSLTDALGVTAAGLQTRASDAIFRAAGNAAGSTSTHIIRREEVAPARRRLLRLLDAVEAAAPEVLRGGACVARPSTSMYYAAQRTCALATFAAHVPDEAWANAPETWTPRKSDRRARALKCVRAPVLSPPCSICAQSDGAGAVALFPCRRRALRRACRAVQNVRAMAQVRRLRGSAAPLRPRVSRGSTRQEHSVRCCCHRVVARVTCVLTMFAFCARPGTRFGRSSLQSKLRARRRTSSLRRAEL